MTANKKKKRAARARQAMTGESYQTALRAITNDDVAAEPPPELVLRYLAHAMPLAKGPITVGRNPSCQLVLDDSLASRKHATFTLEGGTAWVDDHDSRNGVLVNGVRIARRASLAPGDVIKIGNAELRVGLRGARGELISAPPPAPVPSVAKGVGDPPSIGSILAGRYRLERVAMRDGAADACVIYDSQHVLLGGAVTIKLLPRHASATRPHLRAWLLYEARALQRAAHPQVLRVFDISETDEQGVYLVCERAPETTLAQHLATHAEDAVSLEKQLVAILEHLHAHGVFAGEIDRDALRVEHVAGVAKLKLCSLWNARMTNEPRPVPDGVTAPKSTGADEDLRAARALFATFRSDRP